MATIALYAGKMNQMPGLFQEVKKSVVDYKSELAALKKKSLQINQGVCDLSGVISLVQASTQTQEEKITSLDSFRENSGQFLEEADRIDSGVADVVRQRKNEFYNRYNYLKPECEKNGWEKICDGCKKAGEWCREHWVMITTVLVVIAIAVIAVVTFGVAIAAVAAIAGIAALVLCAADVICMVATGGKNIAALCQENGLGWLGEIFSGLSIGCDIVAVVFPAGAAIKTMAKVGVKAFAKASIEGMKTAFVETINKVFKSGFRNGIKNLGTIAFKTFIFDIDDFTRVKNGKRVFDIIDPTPRVRIQEPATINSSGLKADGSFDWPPRDGFEGTISTVTLKPGTRIDRFGKTTGDFVAVEGTPYRNRALRPGTEKMTYTGYEVAEPIEEVLSGITASWFNEPGGGMQFKFSKKIWELLEDGKIKIRNYFEIVGKGFSQFGFRYGTEQVTAGSTKP